MLNVNALFVLFAGVAFLGFILNALFDRLRISSVLPLMLIGLLIGPVFKVVGTGPGSAIAQLTPYVTAVAVAFILFDVGLNMKFSHLKRVIATATKFTFGLEIATGIIVSIAVFLALHFTLGWSLTVSVIFGFAVAGPSSVIVPTLMKLVKVSDDLKTTLLYESVSSDLLQLVVPILLLQIIVGTGMTAGSALGGALSSIIGAAVVGFVSGILWLLLLNRFHDVSQNYSWMLTIAMVIATYSIAELFGLAGAITIFIFGLIFGNIGSITPKNTITHEPTFTEKYLAMPYDIEHVREYQREIVFFTSTFFFVYIGMLFNSSQLSFGIAELALLVTFLFILMRVLFTPMLKEYMRDSSSSGPESSVVHYNVGRGLSPAIVATLPLAYGLVIPSFLDAMFLVILVSNMAATIGLFVSYKPRGQNAKPAKPAAAPA